MKDRMVDKTTEEVQELVGQPTYSLVNGRWVPPTGRQLFTPNELYELFRNESVLFIGDSTQRRAADTLHVVIENRENKGWAFTLYAWRNIKGHHSRVFGRKPNVTISEYRDLTNYPGRIDNLWMPHYDSIFKSFRYDFKRNHTIIITGVGAWNIQKQSHSANELTSLVNRTIHHLHRAVPPSVLIFWKTYAWGRWYDWGYQEPDVKVNSTNYQVYLVNKVAKEVIESINADNLILLDWSREILPYSFENRLSSGMAAEGGKNPDNSAWHVSVTGRMLLLQMLAWEVNQRKALFPVPITDSVAATKSSELLGNLTYGNVAVPNTTSISHVHHLPTQRNEKLPLNWTNATIIGTDSVNVREEGVASDNSSSYRKKLPSVENIMLAQKSLSLLFGFLILAVILARRMHRGRNQSPRHPSTT